MLKMLTPRNARVCASISSDVPMRVMNASREEKHTHGERERGDEDEGEDALGPIKLNCRGTANLRAEKEEDRQDRRFLEDLNHKPYELPLRDYGETPWVRQFASYEAHAVELIDVGQSNEQENEYKQPPVPQLQVILCAGQQWRFLDCEYEPRCMPGSVAELPSFY